MHAVRRTSLTSSRSWVDASAGASLDVDEDFVAVGLALRYVAPVGLDAELTEYYDAEARAGLRGELDPTRLEIRRRHVDVLRARAAPHRHRRRFGSRSRHCRVRPRRLRRDRCRPCARQHPSAVLPTGLSGRHRVGCTGSRSGRRHSKRSGHHEHLRPRPAPPIRRSDDRTSASRRPRCTDGDRHLGRERTTRRPESGGAVMPETLSLATHERWRSMLERHGDIEDFVTYPPTRPSGWEYQYALIRRETSRATRVHRPHPRPRPSIKAPDAVSPTVGLAFERETRCVTRDSARRLRLCSAALAHRVHRRRASPTRSRTARAHARSGLRVRRPTRLAPSGTSETVRHSTSWSRRSTSQDHRGVSGSHPCGCRRSLGTLSSCSSGWTTTLMASARTYDDFLTLHCWRSDLHDNMRQ